MTRSPRVSRYGWILVAILAATFWLHCLSVDFGLPALNDPDELMFEIGALHMLRGFTFDPGWFGHPATTTMYVLALIDAGVFAYALLSGRAATPRQFGELVYTDPGWIILPGRIAMVLFSLATIWVTCRLATRFFGRRAGIAAALLLALDPVYFNWSQIIRSDVMACLFMLLCLQSAASIATAGHRRDYGWAALWLGLAIASKWPFALSGIAIIGATIFAVRTGVLAPARAIRRTAASGLGAIGVLLLASPYLLIDYPTVIRNVQGEGQTRHLGATGGSFVHNFLWYFDGPIHDGFGLLGMALIVLGTIQLFHRRAALAILAPLVLAFLVLLCAQSLVWERWALPILPLGAIVAVGGLVRLALLLRHVGGFRMARWIPPTTLLATAIPLAAHTWSDGRARMNDTRQQASAWAQAHIPAGSSILVEHYGFDLVRQPWRLLFPIGDAGCVDAKALLHGRTNYAAIEQARNGRSNVDWGTMASAKRADCHADFAILAQYDRYRQERDRFPAEYAAYRWLLARGRVVAVFAPVPGRIGGYTVTIVDLRKEI